MTSSISMNVWLIYWGASKDYPVEVGKYFVLIQEVAFLLSGFPTSHHYATEHCMKEIGRKKISHIS